MTFKDEKRHFVRRYERVLTLLYLYALLKVAEKLKYEKIEELKEKSKGQVINLVRKCFQEIVEGIESLTAKNELLNDDL